MSSPWLRPTHPDGYNTLSPRDQERVAASRERARKARRLAALEPHRAKPERGSE